MNMDKEKNEIKDKWNKEKYYTKEILWKKTKMEKNKE